jgi:hypothetical protein
MDTLTQDPERSFPDGFCGCQGLLYFSSIFYNAKMGTQQTLKTKQSHFKKTGLSKGSLPGFLKMRFS